MREELEQHDAGRRLAQLRSPGCASPLQGPNERQCGSTPAPGFALLSALTLTSSTPNTTLRTLNTQSTLAPPAPPQTLNNTEHPCPPRSEPVGQLLEVFVQKLGLALPLHGRLDLGRALREGSNEGVAEGVGRGCCVTKTEPEPSPHLPQHAHACTHTPSTTTAQRSTAHHARPAPSASCGRLRSWARPPCALARPCPRAVRPGAPTAEALQARCTRASAGPGPTVNVC